MFKLALIFLLANLCFSTEKRVGGFQKQEDVALCQERLNKIHSEFPIFKSYKITNCETQLVNGTNYKMNLVNTQSNLVKKCAVVIYEQLNNQVMPLKYREKENDCFTLFENHKVDVTSENW